VSIYQLVLDELDFGYTSVKRSGSRAVIFIQKVSL